MLFAKAAAPLLKTVSAEYVAATKRLGTEKTRHFFHQEEPLSFTLRPFHYHTDALPGVVFDTRKTPFGHIQISEGFSLIQSLSPVPLTAFDETSDAENAVFWALAIEQLPLCLKHLFGDFQPVPASLEDKDKDKDKDKAAMQEQASSTEITLVWELEGESSCASGVIKLSCATLLQWLEQETWSSPSVTVNLPFSVAVNIGVASLTSQAIRELTVGDIVLPQHQIFNAQGAGYVQWHAQRVHVRWQQNQQFVITHIEDLSMQSDVIIEHDSHEHTHAQMHTQDQSQDQNQSQTHIQEQNQRQALDENPVQDGELVQGNEPVQSNESIQGNESIQDKSESPVSNEAREIESALASDIDVPLTVEVGRLRLSLNELASLAPGQVLTVQDLSHGQAVLRYQDRIIGRGDLVQVDERLGIELQSLSLPKTGDV